VSAKPSGANANDKKPETAKITFRLTKVDHESVVLERNNKKYTLAIETPQVQGAEIVVTPSSEL
jgi:hypothetical protein